MNIDGHCCGLDRQPWALNHQLEDATEEHTVKMRCKFSQGEE